MPSPPYSFSRERILIVDDRPENLVALRTVLADVDADIIEAGNGEDALRATLRYEFAVAILDVQMPGMDGYELAYLLRGDPRTHQLPIIFVTAAYREERQIHQGYDVGAVDYIVKPYDPYLLVSKIRVFLELHRAQVALAERNRLLVAAEERYRSMVMTIPDIVYITDKTGRFTFLNGAISLLGYTPKELIGRHFSQIIHPVDIEAVSKKFTSSHVSPAVEYRVRHAAGHYLWFQERTSFIRDQDGTPLLALGVLRNVTDHSEEKSDVITQTRQAFMTQLSHELRTPLMALLGFTERLRDESYSAKEREQALQAILNSGHHLQRLVIDALDLSDAETGQLSLDYQPVDPVALLTNWFNQLNSVAQAKGLTLTVQAISPLPQTFTTDPQRLTQLLHRLGDNAIRFTDRGTVRLLVSCDPIDQRLILALFDTGQGISNTQAQRLLQPFIQGDNSLSRRHGGLGIGLSLARHLAQRLGGDLLLESHPGIGSLFVATIATGPLAKLDTPLNLNLPDSSTIAPTAPSIPRLMGRILLAEDNEHNQVLITHHLAKTGAEITVACNGEEAFSLAMEQDFQLILMDIQMPIMGGLEATQMLRASLYPGPIVALTAHGQDYHRQEALDAGCDDFLTKPVNWGGLYQVIARYLPVADSTKSSTLFSSANDDALAALATRFLADLPATLAQMNQAQREGDLSPVAGLAHQIKGVAAGLGYPALGAAAHTLETVARAGDSRASAAALAELCRLGEL